MSERRDADASAATDGSFWPEPEPCDVLVLSGVELQRLLDRNSLIAAMAEAMQAYSAGSAVMPLRTIMRLTGAEVRLLATMPGYLSGAATGAEEALGAKLVSVYPANPARGLESHYGAVLLFDSATGRPRALLDGTMITTARTAAVSAVSVELLARADAAVLTVIGAGVQAAAHLWALDGTRPWREVRIASRSPEHARLLAARVAPLLPYPVKAIPDAHAAVAGADVVVTATSAATPVVERDRLRAGVHLVAVGSSTPAARELDSATVRDAQVVVDSREGALAEAGDLLIPMREGVIGAEHIHAELGELLSGKAGGREREEQITLYKSLGMAVQDVAAARLAVRRAGERGAGVTVRL